MNTYIKNNLKQALLILEGEGVLEDDFRTAMIQDNDIPGLLSVSVKNIDDKSLYRYDISGKVSLLTKHEKAKLSNEDMERLISALLELLQETQKYMLDASGILLSPEYIYCEGEKYFFCYYPPCKLELTEEFHKLTEFFVREVDYQDKEGIHLAYTLHKSSMEKNYSVEKIMDEVLVDEEVQAVRYDGYVEEQPIDNIVIAEKKELWGSVKRFFDKRKKQHNEWDEMASEQEHITLRSM